MAIASSVTDKAIPAGVAFVGELGLTGEVRRVAYLDQHVGEAVRLGLNVVYAPKSAEAPSKNIVAVERLSNLLSVLFK